MRQLPIGAIIDDGTSAGAIAAICEKATAVLVERRARMQRRTAGLSALPCACNGYCSGRCFTIKSPRGNDSARLPANCCKRYAGHRVRFRRRIHLPGDAYAAEVKAIRLQCGVELAIGISAAAGAAVQEMQT